MPTGFQLDHHLDFHPEDSAAILRAIPASPGVFALRGADLPDGTPSQPYLTRAADLRRRLRRLLAAPEAAPAAPNLKHAALNLKPEALNLKPAALNLKPEAAHLSADSGQPVLSRRLNLRNRVRFIDYTRTGSDFESTLVLYRAARSAFGPDEARRRLRLHTPFFLRVTMSNAHPRVYTTNRLSKKALAETFGPFPSRAAAERYCDAVLDLFQLRRCHEDLQPHPDHPGCVYGEMNKCLQPCKGGAPEGHPPNPCACTPAAYAGEAQRVFAFFSTRGESLLTEIAQQREAASAALDFEAAAALHRHWEKVRAAALLADELVRPVTHLRAAILQSAAPHTEASDATEPLNPAEPPPEDAAVFLLESGRIAGPERLSTLGVRAVREQTAVGSSLFAQPLMLAAIPLTEPTESSPTPSSPTPSATPSEEPRDEPRDPAPASSASTAQPFSTSNPDSTSTLSPEDRARAVLDRLHHQATTTPPGNIDELCDALSLFRRWYYRPEKQRHGEVFLPSAAPPGSAEAAWPIRRILNGAARIVLGPPALAEPVDREAAKTLRTRIIHKGREGVEREVPVLPKRSRTRKAVTPADLAE